MRLTAQTRVGAEPLGGCLLSAARSPACRLQPAVHAWVHAWTQSPDCLTAVALQSMGLLSDEAGDKWRGMGHLIHENVKGMLYR